MMRPSAMEHAAPYVLFRDVEVAYSDLVHGLRGISLSIKKGEFVFLCGPTGSGKSTLLKCLSREVWHTKGIVQIDGRDLDRIPGRDVPLLRRQMGIVPQDFGLLPNKRVWENLSYAMRACGRTQFCLRSRGRLQSPQADPLPPRSIIKREQARSETSTSGFFSMRISTPTAAMKSK